MDRHNRLKICKICKNRRLDLHRGLVCQLTDDFARFEDECQDFQIDESIIADHDGGEKSRKREKNPLSKRLAEFIPLKGLIITPIIIAICSLIFIFMVISGIDMDLPDPNSLLKWGANFKVLVLSGQYWRLLTNCFVHIGLSHLLFNMYALLFIGIVLEPVIGKWRFLLAYLLSGTGASIISLIWHDLMVSAGASGAIFGIYGVYIALLTTGFTGKKSRVGLLISVIIFTGYNLFYGIREGIDNAAHIGGLVTGIFTGYSFYPSLSKPSAVFRNRSIQWGSFTALLIIFFILIITSPNPVGKYHRILQQFSKIEEKALKYYNLKPQATDRRRLEAIRVDGFPNWEKAREIIGTIDSIQGLPEGVLEHVELIKLYCNLRIRSFELLEQSFDLNSDLLDFQIRIYHQKIEVIIDAILGVEQPVNINVRNPINDISSIFPEEALYVIDGLPVEDLDPFYSTDISGITILDRDTGIGIYGERARNGVILITTMNHDYNEEGLDDSGIRSVGNNNKLI